MPDYTVKADVDTMLRANDKAAIRSAIGVGTTDAPTFLAQTLTGTLTASETGTSKNPAVAFPVSGSYAVGIWSPAQYTIQFAMAPSGNLTNTTAYTGLQYEMTTGTLSWGKSASQTIKLVEDAPGILAQRNGTSAQAFRIYNTYTDANNYSRLKIGWDSATYTAFTIEGQQLGTGGGRSLALIGAGNVFGLGVTPSAAFNWVINAGHLLAGADNAFDIGASGASRPRNIYTAGAINIGSGFGLVFGNNTVLFPAASGVLRVGNTSDTGGFRLNGGTLDYCKVQKFDGTGFGAIQGKLTTDTAYTATVVTPTGFLTLYDSTGTAYRVPCVV